MKMRSLLLLAMGLVCQTTCSSENLSEVSLDHYLNNRGFFLNPVHSCKNEGYSSAKQRAEFLKDLQSLSQTRRILEIGFNAGHSAEVFLTSTNCELLVSCDINTHPYVQAGVDFMKGKFGDRFRFVSGSSLKEIPHYAASHPNEKFDLIFIDGCHTYECCTTDIRNCQKLAHRDTIVWIDDYSPWGVKTAVDACVQEGLITLIDVKSVDDVSGNRSWAIARYSYLSDAERVFSNIYKRGLWGKDETGQGSSGPGSTVGWAIDFLDYLQQFLDETPSVQSIVDIGCGDWVLAREIDWGNRNYLGVDVVDSVIQKNRTLYSTDKIRFELLDASVSDIPKVDLVICKDVFIHLPNQTVLAMLEQCKKSKYCLFVNDVDSQQGKQINRDTPIGGFRTIDLTCPPFSLKPKWQSYYYAGGKVLKQMILIEND